jgi:DedD protein
MFNTRSGRQSGSGPAQTPTIESIRRQARHRLMGASVLVLLGIVGLPWLFDTQPRPVPVDLVVSIPARDAAPALERVEPEPEPDPAPDEPPAASAPVPDPAPAIPAARPAPPPPAPTAPTAPAAPARPTAPAPAPAAAPATPSAEASRAQALLEGRAPVAAVRHVVQVGAFADQARAQETRQRLERAGLKTYTQLAHTPEGQRVRVRVGPFETRAEADKAAEAVRRLGLPASVLTL